MKSMTHIRQMVQGFSLVELMVAMAIALVLTLVITRVMLDHEGAKRTSNTTNDANQNAALAAFEIDRGLRSAGSGYMQSWGPAEGNFLGCTVYAQKDNAALLPRTGAFPAPFSAVETAVRLAPVIIYDGGASASDVIRVMGGNSGFAEMGRAIQSASDTGITLYNTFGWRPKDVMLLGSGAGSCVLQQVADTFAISPPADGSLPLAGHYAHQSVTPVAVTSYGVGDGYAAAIGRIDDTSDSPPDFRLFGVDTNNTTLVTYDMLLQTPDAAPTPLADGVVMLKAAYGVDTNGNSKIDDGEWFPATGNLAAASLIGNQNLLRRVLAVRVGLVVRSSLIEKDAVVPENTELKLFKNTSFETTYTITSGTNHRRHRTLEFTIPLRNALLI